MARVSRGVTGPSLALGAPRRGPPPPHPWTVTRLCFSVSCKLSRVCIKQTGTDWRLCPDGGKGGASLGSDAGFSRRLCPSPSPRCSPRSSAFWPLPGCRWWGGRARPGMSGPGGGLAAGPRGRVGGGGRGVTCVGWRFGALPAASAAARALPPRAALGLPGIRMGSRVPGGDRGARPAGAPPEASMRAVDSGWGPRGLSAVCPLCSSGSRGPRARSPGPPPPASGRRAIHGYTRHIPFGAETRVWGSAKDSSPTSHASPGRGTGDHRCGRCCHFSEGGIGKTLKKKSRRPQSKHIILITDGNTVYQMRRLRDCTSLYTPAPGA